ncbi:MAG: hypothetical protein JW702_02955 [Clostridiales bacterium]|nr:hypothetical protein [Clostridiales bacterium]
MSKKFTKYLRLFHRYMTLPFVAATIMVMGLKINNPILVNVQKIMMLTLAVSGTIMYLQIYYRKYFGKKKKI